MAKNVTYALIYQTQDGVIRTMDQFQGQVDLGDDQLSLNEGLRVIARIREQADLMEKVVRAAYDTKE